jgi:signal transduction histidine kinase
MTVHARTILILLGSFLTIIVLFSSYVYLSVSNYANNDFDRLLEIRVLTAAQTELDGLNERELPRLRSDFFERLPHEEDYFFALKEDADFVDEASDLGVPIAFFEEIMRDGKADHFSGRISFKGIRYNGARGEYIVVASAENYYKLHHEAYLKRTLVLAIFAAFMLSVFISVYFSRSVFRPIRNISEQVKQISSENLHLRINEDRGNEELRELARTFNFMLDRIETSFETQNNFISNASHELRTPLTAIIGEADVALSKLRDPIEYIETIKVILEEAEQLERKTKALLFLAQTGFNGLNVGMGKVRMDQLLMDVKATVERVNPKNKVYLDMSLLPENPMKLKVLGNDQLLHLAFSNIILNGCKYSGFKPVSVSLGTATDKVIVVVKDTGIGISEEDLKHIYDPFFRGVNTKGFEGYGIGLPLTQNIIRMHNGEIIVSSILGVGTSVQVNLPMGQFAP